MMKISNAKILELVRYGIIGVLTTVINVSVYTLLTRIFNVNYLCASGVAWVTAVVFAFHFNKRVVFKSCYVTFNQTVKEMIAFVGFRFFTGLLEIVIMYICVDLLLANDLMTKILLNVIVIVLNYVFSKLMIFRQKG